MQIIYKGPTGSGKTSRLLGKYREIANREGTGICLVFVKNAGSVKDWRKRVELETMGLLNVYTYFGFVQKELSDYWPWIESELPGGLTTVEPIFMNIETAHYLMSKYVEKYREGRDVFEYINATSPRIAVQLIDNLNQAAMNNLSLNELKERLLDWAADDREKTLVFNEAVEIMRTFRKFCRDKRLLDYSLMIELYNNYLFDNQDYQRELTERYNYLFVDNLEKAVPAAQQLYLFLFKNTEESYLSYNPEEGINKFFGGNPELARELFFPLCRVLELKESYTSSPAARKLAVSLYHTVLKGKPLEDSNFIVKEIDSELRGEMLERTAEQVLKLLKQGVAPEQICLIAPVVDKVLEFTLERSITREGYSFINLTRSKRLVDIPFSQAMITLTLLAAPGQDTRITYSSLQQTLSLILKLDPVRSAVLAAEIFKNDMRLPEIEQIELRSRIGFDNSARYDYLREWLAGKEGQQLDLEQFFQESFGELLSPLNPSAEDILACRQLIDSAGKFKRVINKFKDISEGEMLKHFIEMIYNGTLAAEVLYSYPEEDQKVVLTTPYKFLFSPDIERVKFLFWLDISSENWFKSIAKELFNPYILFPQWNSGERWDDQTDQTLRREQLLASLQSILSKCTDGVYLVDSYLNSHGWEQEGQLFEWLQSRNTEVRSDA